jgi:hypothetical protein
MGLVCATLYYNVLVIGDASLDSASDQLSVGPSGPNVLGLTVVGHGIAGLLVGRAIVDGAIERDVGLALSVVASCFFFFTHVNTITTHSTMAVKSGIILYLREFIILFNQAV